MGRDGRDGGGCLVAVAVVLGVALVCLGAVLLWLVGTRGEGLGESEGEATETATEEAPETARAFADYSWAELSGISAEISAAGSAEAAAEVAASYGISVGDTRTLELDDGSEVVVRVVGLCQDERSDGAGAAGITLMTSPVATAEMSADPANVDGWEGSDLRAWLASEGLGLLPDDLAAVVLPVLKGTSSRAVTYGATDVSGAVTQTADALWVPSMSEVCGAVTLMTDEYGTVPSANTEYVDFAPYDELLSSEGEQYEFFSSMGVSGASAASPALVMSLPSGETCAWWLRTSYPFTYTASTERLCYQVMASGLPSGLVSAASEAGVAVGFCV